MQRISLLLAAVAVVCCLPATASQDKAPAHYPRQLHGMWIPEAVPCPAPGQSYVGDSAMHIGPRLIQGYEDRSKPVAVLRISKEPLAWRIESLMDVGPSGVYSPDQPEIFVLGEGRVTVVSASHAQTYRRCTPDKVN